MNRFEGKAVIITGASSGIGAATARRFSSEGALLLLVDLNEEKLSEVAASCDGQVISLVADVGEEWEAEKIVSMAMDQFGKIDVLVNNAGLAVEGNITEIDLSRYKSVMATLVDSVFLLSRAAIPHLKETKGCIINTNSVSGLGGDWGMPVYNLAKGAIANFTRALALDHGLDGIRVNAVAPTLTRTGMSQNIYADSESVAKIEERVALGRSGEPEDIAPAIAFLASQDAAFITGVILPVDGGLSASSGQPRLVK